MTKIIKKVLLSTLLVTTLSLIGCSSKESIIDEVRTPPKNLPVATISILGYEDIEAELYPHIAPNTVNNFIYLANNGFYDGLTLHRIVKDFVLQGGCPDGTGMGGPGYSIKGEFTNNNFKNGLKHGEGILSMARSQDNDSAGSQFFIVTKDAPNLNNDYASFGKVIKGMSIINELNNTKVGSNDKPEKDIVIESIKVDTKGENYEEPERLK